MAVEGEGDDHDLPNEPSRGDVVLVADPSAEGGNVVAALRAEGFSVVDVPIALLEARALGEVPRVLVIDVDQAGALAALERIRDDARVREMDLVCIGDPARAAELGVGPSSDRLFSRPIDVQKLVAEVALLATRQDHVARGTTPPPSLAKRRESSPPVSREAESDPLISSEYPAIVDTLDVSSIVPSAEPLDAPKLIHAEFSSDLQRILNAAAERLSAAPGPGSMPPAVDEVDFILSPELLASLDEPLDPDEEDEEGTGSSLGIGTPMAFGSHARGTANPTHAHPEARLTAQEAADEASSRPSDPGDLPPLTILAQNTPPPRSADTSLVFDPDHPRVLTPRPDFAPTPSAVAMSRGLAEDARLAGVDPASRFERFERFERDESPSEPPHFGRPPAPITGTSADKRIGSAAPRIDLPAVLGQGGAIVALARAIAGRASGSLALNTDRGMRRVMLQDGDILTAGLGIADETLLSFLAARGDIERETAAHLVGKLPPFGRHAGAALIAHGHLGQDDLWPVLRAHAEWIIGRAVVEEAGTCELEAEPPGRFKAEPSVFGGATGAEVFVETLRRAVPLETATQRLGGSSARLEDGPRQSLLSECALRPEEQDAVRDARGKTVGEVVGSTESELVTVLYACVALEILAVLAVAGNDAARGSESDPLDEEAVRRRVRARFALVEDGDYFALLGVPRGATSYEVRRAYVALRRSFEPSRLLTAKTVDLAADLRVILEVLDEAFEILKEPHRRERYRRAIEAGPP